MRQARKHGESDDEEEEDSENDEPESQPHRSGGNKRKTDVDMSLVWEDHELGADGLWHKKPQTQQDERDNQEWHRERAERRASWCTFKAPSKKWWVEEEEETHEYERKDLDSGDVRQPQKPQKSTLIWLNRRAHIPRQAGADGHHKWRLP